MQPEKLPTRYRLTVTLFLLLSFTVINPFHAQEALKITGSGASFPAPLIAAMATHYQNTNSGVSIAYSSIGSGAGKRQFMGQEVMFATTEAYLPVESMSEVKERTGGQAFHLPITLADVVVTYNIPGVETGVIFNGEVLANIFLGKITNWSDASIKALNPGIQLPNLAITVIYRSDASGTTNLFTNFLNAVSPEWAQLAGRGTLVTFPVGHGARGNEGVAAMVVQTEGSIGYNSFAFATLNNMSYGWLMNQAGNTIEPSFRATTEAANIQLPDDMRVLFTNTPAPEGYPIAGFTWALVYENLEHNKAVTSREAAVQLINFLAWAITDGQNLSEMLGYARLPEVLVQKNLETLRQLKWNGEPLGKQLIATRQ